MSDRTAWIIVAALIVGLFIGLWQMNSRLDDLEARMTTAETVRIEYVAPAKDSG